MKDYGNIPGIYAAGLYINGMVAEAALEKTGGKTEDRDALIRRCARSRSPIRPAGRSPSTTWATSSATSTSGGSSSKGDKLVNTTIKTYPEGEPVLDVRREVVPGAAGVLARLSAAEELSGPVAGAGRAARMSLWLLLAVNSITLGGLLFLLSAGFSLIFGLMRIPNLTHGSFFMLGAYLRPA